MNLKRVVEPEAIAVYGVSLSNPFHPANVIYHKNHLRYRARTYAVNPKGGDLYGEKVYRNIGEIDEKIDVAVLGIRAEWVPDAMKQCIDAGALGAIVISGGFAEVGRHDLQDQIRALSREHDFPVIGPNCLGVFSKPHFDTFFLPPERLINLEEGGVALVSQSGGILVDLMIKLTQERVGISRAISIGNKAALDEVDLVEFLRTDPKTKVVGMYLEGFSKGRGRDFVNMLGEMKKPVVFLKSGKTPGGSKAVQSHTASMAGDYRVLHEVLKRAGALEARTETEFVSFCEALTVKTEKPVKHICIITASGGHGAIASDGCYDSGLQIVDVPEEDQNALRGNLSRSVQPIASLGNPIDLTGSAGDHDFIESVRFFLQRDYVDALMVLCLPYLPAITPDLGARIATVAREFKKPVVTYMPHIEKYEMFIEGFESNGVPVAHSVEGAVHMARALGRNN